MGTAPCLPLQSTAPAETFGPLCDPVMTSCPSILRCCSLVKDHSLPLHSRMPTHAHSPLHSQSCMFRRPQGPCKRIEQTVMTALIRS